MQYQIARSYWLQKQKTEAHSAKFGWDYILNLQGSLCLEREY